MGGLEWVLAWGTTSGSRSWVEVEMMVDGEQVGFALVGTTPFLQSIVLFFNFSGSIRGVFLLLFSLSRWDSLSLPSCDFSPLDPDGEGLAHLLPDVLRAT